MILLLTLVYVLTSLFGVLFFLLHTLKRKVKNKARVEGSICEAYIVEEMSTFYSHFFGVNV